MGRRRAGAAWPPRGRWMAGLAAPIAVVVAYHLAARMGLALATSRGDVTPIWPPAGIALAALALGGRRLWPAIAVADFVTTALLSDHDATTAALLALANVAQPLVGLKLLERVGFRTQIDRLRDVLALVLVGGIASCAVGASIGVGALVARDVLPASAGAAAWGLWWLGDVAGIILVTPVLLLWGDWRTLAWRRIAELAALIGVMTVAGWPTLFERSALDEVVLLLAMAVAARRLGRHGASAANLVTFGLALYGVHAGRSGFGGVTAVDRAVILQFVTVVLGVSVLALGAFVDGRAHHAPSPDRARWAIPAMVLAAVLWGLAGDVAGRLLTRSSIPPIHLAATRAMVAAVGLAFLPGILSRHGPEARRRSLLVPQVVLGVSMVLHFAAYYEAMARMGVAQATVLLCLSPVFVVAATAVRAKRPPSAHTVAVLVALIVGIALVVRLNQPAGLDGVGIVLGVFAAVTFALFGILSERVGAIVGAASTAFRTFAIAAALWSAYFVLTATFPSEALSPARVLGVMFIGLCGNMLPFLLFAWSVQHTSPATATMVSTLDPVAAALIAWAWLGQALLPLQVFGGGLVVLAVLSLARRDRAESRAGPDAGPEGDASASAGGRPTASVPAGAPGA